MTTRLRVQNPLGFFAAGASRAQARGTGAALFDGGDMTRGLLGDSGTMRYAVDEAPP